MFADLHLHSHFSDGTFTPEEVADRARRCGLGAAALTDHDTVEGGARFLKACSEEGIEGVLGAELTAEEDDTEVHILGYFLDPTHARLSTELAACQQTRQDRIRQMAAKLNDLGIPLRAEAVFELAQCQSPGRPHVARALVTRGHCRSLDEAFQRFLRMGRPAWVPKRRMSAAFAIDLIHDAGGVAVMAHPALTRKDSLIPKLADFGLDGLECWHTKHTAAQTDRYLAQANECRLLITGGSDCHGMSKGRPLIGSVRLPWHYYEELKEAAARRKAANLVDQAAAKS
ncbi:MAG: PHP domain-containing protein [Verrucomicrobiae bacterium]|nr:PHP domain-containing protein [Verrucomicrobiae bacterium]MCP5521046.1 PHP domain-containing protein [Verrucomicrobiales bacterium]